MNTSHNVSRGRRWPAESRISAVIACLVVVLLVAPPAPSTAKENPRVKSHAMMVAPANIAHPAAGQRVAKPPVVVEQHPDKAIVALFTDDFESGFPGTTWTVTPSSPEQYWNTWTCWSASGSSSVGCAAGGTNAITCGQNYGDFMETWMTFGPISLADPGITAATFNCVLNLFSEVGFDFLFMGVSIDGSQYYGTNHDGIVNGPVSIDLSNIFTLGNVIGQSQVWFTFVFQSDEAINAPNGAQIDDVSVLVDMPVTNQPPQVAVTSPNGGETLSAGSTHTITYTASDPDSGPSPLSISIDYSADGGATWTSVVAGQTNTGSYAWTVPATATTNGYIGIRANDGAAETPDTSDAPFTITAGGSNTLSMSTTSGASGTMVSVPLTLDNENPVKGLQVDILYDPAVVTFASVAASGRGAGMQASGALVSPGRARVLVFYDAAGQLTAGLGEVAQVSFTIQGAGGTSTALTLADAVLSGPEAESLPVGVTAGQINVSTATAAPTLQIAALRNPGRIRSLQVLVAVENGSGNPPMITATAGSVTLAPLGSGVYLGTYHAINTASEVTFTASDTNANGTGSSQVTVAFP